MWVSTSNYASDSPMKFFSNAELNQNLKGQKSLALAAALCTVWSTKDLATNASWIKGVHWPLAQWLWSYVLLWPTATNPQWPCTLKSHLCSLGSSGSPSPMLSALSGIHMPGAFSAPPTGAPQTHPEEPGWGKQRLALELQHCRLAPPQAGGPEDLPEHIPPSQSWSSRSDPWRLGGEESQWPWPSLCWGEDDIPGHSCPLEPSPGKRGVLWTLPSFSSENYSGALQVIPDSWNGEPHPHTH